MIPWLFASLLAGSILSVVECTFILLYNGPFWVGSVLYLQTWLYYSLLIALGLLPWSLLIQLWPGLRRRLENSLTRFWGYFLPASLMGSVLLVLVVKSDLDSGSQHLTLSLLLALTLVVTTFVLRRLLHSADRLPRYTFLTAALLIVLGLSFHRTTDRRYTAELEKRSQSFTGEVPHCFLLVLDATRGDHFSCGGYAFPTTPNLDRLAAEGLLCRNAYSASNWTPPGHISIFTGKYPPQHANNGEPFMPEELVSLTEILRNQGYYCLGYYDNPLAGRTINLTQGFDREGSLFRDTWAYPAPFRLWNKFIRHESMAQVYFALSERTFKWVAARHGHLFLYVNILETHTPYQPREPYFTQFTEHLDRNGIGHFQQVQRLCASLDMVIHDSSRFAGFTDQSYAYLRAAYDSELAYVDHHVGRFAEHLRKSGLLDKILLVVTADHGEFLGEHATVGHPKLLLNPVLRIPLILRYPAKIPPGIQDGLTSNVDVLPTTLGLMNLSTLIPADGQGQDVLTIPPAKDRELLSVHLNPNGACYSLVNQHYKLLLNDDDSLLTHFPYRQLCFDLWANAQEKADRDLDTSAISAQMLQDLLRWKDRITVAPKAAIRVRPETVDNLKALGYVQ